MQTKGLAYNLQGSVPGAGLACLLEASTVHCGGLEGLGSADPKSGAPSLGRT